MLKVCMYSRYVFISLCLIAVFGLQYVVMWNNDNSIPFQPCRSAVLGASVQSEHMFFPGIH